MQHFKLITMTAVLASTISVNAQKNIKKALLVIDVQENLLDVRSKLHMDPAEVSSFIRNLNKSITFFKEHNLPVIYTVNEWSNPILNLLTGNVCKKGSKGTGIDKRVTLVNDTIYKKSKNNALVNKELVKFLKENAISELYITGLFAEACIKATTKAALNKSYSATIIGDATGSKSTKNKLKSIGYCKRKGPAFH
jgi:nicotinamidase-related amidase